MKKTSPEGLTNKIKVHNQFLTKKTTKSSDYYIDRENENNFYRQTQNFHFLKVPFKMKQTWSGQWKSKIKYFPNAWTLTKEKLDDKMFKRVKSLIDELHQLNLELKSFNPQEFLLLFTDQVGIISRLTKIKPVVEEIIEHYYDDNKPTVVSHNDLVADNFLIINKELFLIDFEYVSYNHLLFDYASFMSETCNFSQAKTFKKMLNLNEMDDQKLQDLILYQNYLWAHWAKYMYTQTQNQVYYYIMETKIKQALNWKF